MYIYIYMYTQYIYIYIHYTHYIANSILIFSWLPLVVCPYQATTFCLSDPASSSFKSSSSSMSPEGSCQPVDTLVKLLHCANSYPPRKTRNIPKKHQRHHPQQQEMRNQNKQTFLNRKIHITPDLTDKNCGCTNNNSSVVIIIGLF